MSNLVVDSETGEIIRNCELGGWEKRAANAIRTMIEMHEILLEDLEERHQTEYMGELVRHDIAEQILEKKMNIVALKQQLKKMEGVQ